MQSKITDASREAANILAASMDRKKFKHFFLINWAQNEDPLARRQKLKDMLVRRSVRGVCAVEVWSRDCDMCEGTSLSRIPATITAYERLVTRELSWAEGPTTFRVLDPCDWDQWEPSFRDRVAEAWDDGNTAPYFV